MEIVVRDGQYVLTENVAVRVYHLEASAEKEVRREMGSNYDELHYALRIFKMLFHERSFSAKEAMEVLGFFNVRKAQRLLKRLAEVNLVDTHKAGKNTVFRLPLSD